MVDLLRFPFDLRECAFRRIELGKESLGLVLQEEFVSV